MLSRPVAWLCPQDQNENMKVWIVSSALVYSINAWILSNFTIVQDDLQRCFWTHEHSLAVQTTLFQIADWRGVLTTLQIVRNILSLCTSNRVWDEDVFCVSFPSSCSKPQSNLQNGMSQNAILDVPFADLPQSFTPNVGRLENIIVVYLKSGWARLFFLCWFPFIPFQSQVVVYLKLSSRPPSGGKSGKSEVKLDVPKWDFGGFHFRYFGNFHFGHFRFGNIQAQGVLCGGILSCISPRWAYSWSRFWFCWMVFL